MANTSSGVLRCGTARNSRSWRGNRGACHHHVAARPERFPGALRALGQRSSRALRFFGERIERTGRGNRCGLPGYRAGQHEGHYGAFGKVRSERRCLDGTHASGGPESGETDQYRNGREIRGRWCRLTWCTLSSEMPQAKPVPPSAGSPDTVIGEEDLRIFREFDRFEQILMRQRLRNMGGRSPAKPMGKAVKAWTRS